MNTDIKALYDSVEFYCPRCKERIETMWHSPYVCGCGKKWKCSIPKDSGGQSANVEINGIPTKI